MTTRQWSQVFFEAARAALKEPKTCGRAGNCALLDKGFSATATSATTEVTGSPAFMPEILSD
jgi:hypothetical protein